MTALPICDIELSVEAPKSEDYPHDPQTLGDFLRKKRIDEGIERHQICEDLGIAFSTLQRWEENWIQPQLKNRRKLKKYLTC